MLNQLLLARLYLGLRRVDVEKAGRYNCAHRSLMNRAAKYWRAMRLRVLKDPNRD